MSDQRYLKSRTRSSNVSTVIGIALVLFMLGVLGFLVLNARSLERYFKENVRVELFLKRDLKEVDVMQFRKELDTEVYTFETRYVTADEAAEQLKKAAILGTGAHGSLDGALALDEVRVQRLDGPV